MPRIQEYQSQVDIQPVQAPQVEMQNFTGGWKNATDAFKALDTATKQLEEVRNTRELTKASNDYQIELADITAQADADPNPDNAPIYRQKIDEAMAKHTQSISAPLVREQAAESFRLKGYTTFSGISSKFNKQNIEIAHNEFIKNVEIEKQNYMATVDPVKKRESMDSVMNSIDLQVKGGVLTANEANTMRNSISKNWSIGEAMRDAKENPALAKEQYKAGYYTGLDTVDEQVKFEDFLGKMEKRSAEEAKVKKADYQIKNQMGLIMSEKDGNGVPVGPDDISAMVANEEISREYGEAWIAYTTNPDISELKTKNPGFTGHIQSVLKSKSKKDISNALLEVLKDKNTTKDELQIIAGLASQRGNEVLGITVDQGIKPGSKQPSIDNNLKAVLDWATNIPQVEADQLTKTYLANIATMTPEEAADKAKREAILNVFPETAGYGEIPTMVYSKDDSLYTIFSSPAIVAPHKIYDPKSKSMVTNHNREITNK